MTIGTGVDSPLTSQLDRDAQRRVKESRLGLGQGGARASSRPHRLTDERRALDLCEASLVGSSVPSSV